jgi:Carboxypeptidase regulatory-like domain
MRTFSLSVALIALSIAIPISAQAQVQAPFALRGTVVDPAGHGIAGARVTSVRTDTAARQAGPSTRADANGAFELTLPAGAYAITVDAPAFRDATERVIAIDGGSASRTIQLDVAGVRETVSVSAPSPGDSSTPTVGALGSRPLV